MSTGYQHYPQHRTATLQRTIKGVFYNTAEYMRSALSLLASRKITFELLISEQRPLKDLEQVFCQMKAHKVIKVAMIP